MRIKIAEGLEIPVNTTTVLIAAFIVVPLVGQLIGVVDRWVKPKEAPICYASRQVKTPVPVRPLPVLSEAVEQTLGAHIPELRRQAIAAERACPIKNCPPAQQKAYANAVDSYLSYRMSMMAKMELNYGEPGLDFAREFFSTSTDKNIENGFIVRHASGDYHGDSRVTTIREAVAILTDPTRGRRYFEPCPTPRPGPATAASTAR